jgi:Tol biopolymer transport system component
MRPCPPPGPPRLLLPVLLLALAACATTPERTEARAEAPAGVAAGGGARGPEAPAPVTPAPAFRPAPEVAGERHLADVRQLTFGGENAEAYWSFAGDRLVFQARRPEEGCDRIWRMDGVLTGAPTLQQVSSGAGATTCAYFLPGDRDVVYASTHLGGAACPPRPDMREGYVWALYDSYDVFRARADGTGVQRLTDAPGYDAEATVCGKDGSIVFTSVRDGDLELYRMDADGRNVRRLTHTPGYDGGAFFNADCSKLVWRASRPTGAALEDYRALLARGLVRPSKLELYVANADGSEPVQVTYLDAASFAPYWVPGRDRLLFSSNVGDPKGREFNLWAVDADGTDLEQVTFAPGFDGFPMFSPDGRWLVFGSNRGNAPGARDTNLFLARWAEDAPGAAPAAAAPLPSAAPAASGPDTGAAERLAKDVAWLAAPERGGRGVGTPGLEASGAWLAARFRELGLEPAGEGGDFRQPFPVATAVRVEPGTRLTLAGTPAPEGALVPLGFSASGTVKGPLVLAGYGIVAPELGRDDYAGLDVKGKVVLVRRFSPQTGPFADPAVQRRHGDFRAKAWAAKQRGAKGLLVVDWPEDAGQRTPPPGSPPGAAPVVEEAPAPALRVEGPGDAGMPVAVVRHAALAAHLPALAGGRSVPVELSVALATERTPVFNVVGRLRAGAPEAERLPGVVVVGAHYDHLGMGGPSSLAPGVEAPHLGADDNASGTAALLEVARRLAAGRSALRRDVLFVAFSAEELGVLGSTHFTRLLEGSAAGGKGARGRAGGGASQGLPGGVRAADVVAMLNMDMVGRLRGNALQVLGVETAREWREAVEPACAAGRLSCTLGGDGYGPSDHMPFFTAGIPVLHFFTGAHADYHRPSDRAEAVNYGGLARVAAVVADTARAVAGRPQRLTFQQASPAAAPVMGDRRGGGASLGTVPDYAGPPGGVKGMLLAGVRPGGAADAAGLRRGDVLVRLGPHAVGGVEDLMFALSALEPGQQVTAVVVREGRELSLPVTLQAATRR